MSKQAFSEIHIAPLLYTVEKIPYNSQRYSFGTIKSQREDSRIPIYFHIVTTCFILSSICITFEISSVPEEHFCGYTNRQSCLLLD